uniref:4F5 domain-containing protein n=1 Tax=Rhabditophanes sp. KR3021 TaxID=114890 RepID=A0AC35UAQ8_9BILA
MGRRKVEDAMKKVQHKKAGDQKKKEGRGVVTKGKDGPKMEMQIKEEKASVREQSKILNEKKHPKKSVS